MASVNKIKELAAARNYDVAVDILDAQDLEKSLNPQFVRTCGEIYENVGRYADARKQYVRAHIMADGNSRVLQSLVVLYLKRGFKDLAQKYYEHYIFIESSSQRKIDDLTYIMKKADKAPYEELYDLLYPYYRDNMDEDWSFELILLCLLMDKDDIDVVISDYMATFKTSKNIDILYEVIQNRVKIAKYFDIFNAEETEDDDPEEEEVRKIEAAQLEKDYLVRNPKDPEILLMVDDQFAELSNKQKRKYRKKNLKEVLGNKKDADSDQTSEDGEPVEGENAVTSAAENLKKGFKRMIKRTLKRDESSDENTEESEVSESEEGKASEKSKEDISEKKNESEKTGEASSESDDEVKTGPVGEVFAKTAVYTDEMAGAIVFEEAEKAKQSAEKAKSAKKSEKDKKAQEEKAEEKKEKETKEKTEEKGRPRRV